MTPAAEPAAPSPFLLDRVAELRATQALGPALDVACGRGRHSLALGEQGLRCIGLDRDCAALGMLVERARRASLPVAGVAADLERAGSAIPLAEGCAGAVLVFRYLWRPLAPALAALLAKGGLLLYETFTRAQGKYPHGPRNPAFLLAEGELPALFPALEVLRFEEGVFAGPGGTPEALARLVARRPR